MGKKIFVSYKYSDTNVLALPDYFLTTARNYVDVINSLIDEGEDHIYKGEDDSERMATLCNPPYYRTGIKLTNQS